jgi:hypothetical protein
MLGVTPPQGETTTDVGVDNVGTRFKARGLLVMGFEDGDATEVLPATLRSRISNALLGIPPLKFAPPAICKPPAFAIIVSRSGHDI